jgi:hypothetical protein
LTLGTKPVADRGNGEGWVEAVCVADRRAAVTAEQIATFAAFVAVKIVAIFNPLLVLLLFISLLLLLIFFPIFLLVVIIVIFLLILRARITPHVFPDSFCHTIQQLCQVMRLFPSFAHPLLHHLYLYLWHVILPRHIFHSQRSCLSTIVLVNVC